MSRCSEVNKSRLLMAIFLGTAMWFGNLAAQPDTLWTRRYGGAGFDGSGSVQQTQDGGYIIAGGTTSFGAGSYDVWLLKTDANGDTLWTRTYGGSARDNGYSVQQTQDGGYIIGGLTESFGAGEADFWLLKTDANGDTLWTRTYGGTGWDELSSVQQTQDLGYIITGFTWSFGAGKADLWLLKTDAKGDTLWTRTYGGTDRDFGNFVQQTQDLGYIITGETWSFGGGEADLWLLKTDANGDTLWTRTYGLIFGEVGFSVLQTQDGGYIIAGMTESFGAGSDDVWLLKTDANGDTLWTRTYGGIEPDGGFSIQQTHDLGYIIVGVTVSFGAGLHDIWLLKTDAKGDTLWTRTYGGPHLDGAGSVQQTQDLGYIIAGATASFGRAIDLWLIKTAPDVGGIEEGDEGLAIGALRLEAYPNPFTQKAVIRIRPSGSSQQPARVKIYDSAGRLVKTLESAPGDRTIEWDGTDDNNERLGSGIYFVRVSTGSFTAMEKLIMLR